jgi:hypothetical protein
MIDFMKYLKMLMSFLISIPGARRVISPVFYYFGIFDDMFLYQYYNRTYGDTISAFFVNINEIESKKWSIIDYRSILSILDIK